MLASRPSFLPSEVTGLCDVWFGKGAQVAKLLAAEVVGPAWDGPWGKDPKYRPLDFWFINGAQLAKFSLLLGR